MEYVLIVFTAVTIWIVTPLYLRHRWKMRASSADARQLDTLRQKLEQRIENLEGMVGRVDTELNRKLDRLAERQLSPSRSGSAAQNAWAVAATAPSTPPSRPRIEAGTRLADRFVVEALVGVGGMGEVYRARDEKLGEMVALKVLGGLHLVEGDGIARLRREATVARRITHPNVVRLHDVGEDRGLHFISMEYVEGESLGTRIARDGPFATSAVCEVAAQVCDALDAAHAVGVVHRDLKPHNILLDARERCRVIDFGIAKLAYLEGMTATGVIVGTPEYMAPEQILGGDVDERTDLYALGTILFECLTGKAPYRATSAIAVGFAHCHEPIPSVRAARPDLDEAWDEFLGRALAKDPRERFRSAEDMRAALPE